MSQRKNNHYEHLEVWLRTYAEERALDFNKYSPFHMRIMDGGYTVIDFWTTGRYWVMATDYNALGLDMVERAGEKGTMQTDDIIGMSDWLDKLFYGMSD